MAAEFTVRIDAGAQEVLKVLREGMAHIELVSEDTFQGQRDDTYIAVLLYQHYFMRVGNQLALMLLVSGDSQSARVKSVACASSRDMVLSFDMGAAGDFATEPINLLRERFGRRAT